MTPYYEDGSVTIYHGRWEDVLPTLRPQCSDGLGNHTHGQPKPRAKTVDTQALANLLELMATRRANANIKPRAECTHMGCSTARCEVQ